MRAWRRVAVLLLALLAPAGCRRGAEVELVVSGAISMREALDEAGAAFARERPGVVVRINTGASGELARQIEAGAPADVFVSADEPTMDRLAARGLIDDGSRRVIASNRLALAVRAGALPGLTLASLPSDTRVQRLAIGAPKTVPAGAYAERWLASKGALDALRPRLVEAGNARQVLDWVARGEADAGLVYATDLATQPGVIAADLAPAAEVPIRYPAAALRASSHPAEARAFVEQLAGPAGRRALAARGFLPP